MTTELIDWTTMPEGVAVMMGNVLGKFVCHALDYDICYVKTEHLGTKTSGYKTIRERTANCLRLAPADQQPWLVYEEGVTVVPEWAKAKYKITESGDYGQCTYLDEVTTLPKFIEENYEQYEIAQYKITGIKDGWTDNPNQVTE